MLFSSVAFESATFHPQTATPAAPTANNDTTTSVADTLRRAPCLPLPLLLGLSLLLFCSSTGRLDLLLLRFRLLMLAPCVVRLLDADR